MNASTTMDDYIPRLIWALWIVGSVVAIYLAGRMAERRGRSSRTWAWIAACLLGPLALPLLLLLPNLRKDPGDPNGGKRAAEMTGATKPAVADPDPDHLSMAFA